MKHRYFIIFLFYSMFISAAWQDWIPNYFKPKPVQVEQIEAPAPIYTFEQLLKDPKLNKQAYSELEQAIKRDDYMVYPVFTDKNRNLTIHQQLRSNIYAEKGLQKKIDTIQNEWVKRVTMHTLLGGTTGALSGWLLKELLRSKYMKFGGVTALTGLGTAAGFAGGAYRLNAQKEEKQQALDALKKARSIE